MDLRSCPDRRGDETTAGNVGSRLLESPAPSGDSHHRTDGSLVLAENMSTVPLPLRDRHSRDTFGALQLPRRMSGEFRSLGEHEYRSSGVQEFRSSGVQDRGEKSKFHHPSQGKREELKTKSLSEQIIRQLLNSCNSCTPSPHACPPKLAKSSISSRSNQVAMSSRSGAIF